VLVRQYFGISADEAGRAERSRKRFESVRWAKPVYPLLEMGWSRRDCLEWLRGRVPHPVPRSACTFCPFRSNREWSALKQADPEGWRRAVEFDEALRQAGSLATRSIKHTLYLHRSCVPLAEIDFNALAGEALHPMASGECHGMCGV
jgi:hypothetical protein